VTQKSSPLIITLDGPSGSGKSTVAHRLAEYFKVPCLDTGAMYRRIALQCLREGLALDRESDVLQVASRFSFRFRREANQAIVEASDKSEAFQTIGKEIRTPEVSMAASQIAKLKSVRQRLVSEQQRIGQEHGAVVEGRDAGTVIFPTAKFKFFLTASSEERAKRRHRELSEKLEGQVPTQEEVLKEMIQRDAQDSGRVESPLKPAEDAVMVDTSGRNLDEVFEILVKTIERA